MSTVKMQTPGILVKRGGIRWVDRYALALFVALPLPNIRASWVDALKQAEVDVHGFYDIRGGIRTQRDPHEEEASLAESRLQLETAHYRDWFTFQGRMDLLYDGVEEGHSVDLEEGSGWLDLREAHVQFSPHPLMDVKMGRQIITWGVGDLLFINDLFPKDWQAFFLGRDESYLKAPSDATMVSLFPSIASIDIVYTPRFDADRFIRGERLSFWNAMQGGRSGQDALVQVDQPTDWWRDEEIALRLSRTFRAYESSLYGYTGFWKSPAGTDPSSGRARFPRLRAYGASVRGPWGPGLLKAEMGYYDSRDDSGGTDPFVRNQEMRWLLGYDREVGRDFTVGIQYYLEYMLDHRAYRRSLPDGLPAVDRDRHVLTLRLSKLLMEQNLHLSLFAYFSPTDTDAYLRPYVGYKVTDNWLVASGANVFIGEDDHTFFAQFERNNNVYAALRYSF